MEMLYAAPYPTEPQNDHTPEKADRNAEIIARFEAGEAGASIAKVFHISEQRVSQIVRRQRG
jgi:Mor family transcriptional regulator